MGRSLDELVRSGRAAGVFCRLAQTGFTGLVYLEHEDGGGVFSFRDGMPVYAEDLGEAPLLADDMLERGVVDDEQYAQIASRVLELSAEDEDLAFCEVAVELGILTQAQVDAELERRLRGRFIQAVGWTGCRIELDSDPDSVARAAQYPQDIGPLIATGVRTFFDEEAVREVLGDLDSLHVRLSSSEADAVQFFDLGDEDEALLLALKPDEPVERAIDRGEGDWLEGWQLIAMLAIAEHVEIGSSPFAPVSEPSGVRSNHAIGTPAGRYADASGVREERVNVGSLGKMAAVNPPQARGDDAASARRPVVERTDSADSAQRARPRSERPAASTARTALSSGERVRVPPSPAAKPRAAAPRAAAAAPPRADSPMSPRASAPASPRTAAVPRRDPKRKLSTALQRLERNLKDIRQATPAPPARTAVRQTSGAVPSAGEPARAHVEQLLRMRSGRRPDSGPGQPARTPEVAKDATDAFKQAQELMRDNQWQRAHELMRKVCELDSQNDLYLMYLRWAALRANALDEDGQAKLRGTLRDKLSDDELGKFAYYALGHLALAEKKDEAAEKFFRKALEMDKTNKDAERHLRIIELRRKSAKEQANNKIFGIEIGKKKS